MRAFLHLPASLSLSASQQWGQQDTLHDHGGACNQRLPKPTCPGESTSLQMERVTVPLLICQFKPFKLAESCPWKSPKESF
jgi:hypothetical protein